MAFAAAEKAAANSGEYSPLFIYGGHGLGKTHLLRAICHAVSAARPAAKIICLTAENFMRAFTGAVADKRLGSFRERFENCDLLAIDDFHVLGDGAKIQTQKELAQIIEHLAGRGAQVVFAGSFAPKDIENLQSSLVSRLQSGLTVGIDNLNAATRRELLIKQTEKLGLAPEIIDYLANALTGDAREILGAVKQLRLRAGLAGTAEPLTLAAAQAALVSAKSRQRHAAPEDIITAVTEIYGVSATDLLGSRRLQNIAQARRAAAHLLRYILGGSLAETGAVLGGRNHSTIVSLLKKPPFGADRVLERQKFARALTRLGQTVSPDIFVAPASDLFKEKST
jgi:chromosomal replication initiator protein